jgi:hypothetical protein
MVKTEERREGTTTNEKEEIAIEEIVVAKGQWFS